MNDVTDNNNNSNGEHPPRSPGVLKIMQSILAGAFGVQSDKRRREDFSHHSPLPYIIAGVLFTAAFVGGLIVVVQLVLVRAIDYYCPDTQTTAKATASKTSITAATASTWLSDRTDFFMGVPSSYSKLLFFGPSVFK